MCNRSGIIECPACGNQRLCEDGPSGFEAPYGIDYRDGGILSDWIVCRACDGTGEIEVPVELVDEYDLDEIPPPDPEEYGVVVSLAGAA